MNTFNFFIPTQIRFGAGRVKEIGEAVAGYGKRCMLVSSPDTGPLRKIHSQIKEVLSKHQIEVFHFDGVVPNPTIDSVEIGLVEALKNNVDCVLGVGGGSAMDTAKLIALLYSAEGTHRWEKLTADYSNPFKLDHPRLYSLPIVTVTTTSGTGSHLTQAAVVTDSLTEEKLTIFHQENFPRLSIVDPELMLSVPVQVTASTGFDVFAHAFESFLGDRTSPMTSTMSLDTIRLVINTLPKMLQSPDNLEYRTDMALADTMAGICLANGGANIPHPLSEIIGGICPNIAHGECLALVYPEFLKCKVEQESVKFAQVSRVINEKYKTVSDKVAAESLCEIIDDFLINIGLMSSLKEYGITQDEYQKIINNPILGFLPFAPKEILQQMLIKCYARY